MDAITSLITNIPEWIKRLDDLSSQIDQRQLELARVVEPDPSASSASAVSRSKSVRNKGSTESLKPQDEGAAWQGDESANASTEAGPSTAPPSSPTAVNSTPSALQHQTNQVMEVAQAKARATLRKRNKRSDSLISAEGGAPKYRTRSMIIVYYDSYVQSFFEELVKFVSASRNMMRKAKMAAKVAHIKRMAELEMPDADEDDKIIAAASLPSPMVAAGDPGTKLTVDTTPIIAVDPNAAKATDDNIIAAADPGSQEDLPVLNFPRTRNMRGPGMLASGRPMYMRASGRAAFMGSGVSGSYLASGQQQQPDVYDELDKGLEYVQSMCEHAAHQFLRDGDCNEEIENVKRRLAETKEQADREMERIKKEDPDALKTAEEPPKTRSYRRQSMRKDTPSTTLSGSKEAMSTTGAIAAAKAPLVALEVDEGVEDMDEDTPKLMYRSTRRM